MLSVSTNFSILLNNLYNYKDIINNLKIYHNYIFDYIKDSKNISKDIKFDIKKYPKYPFNFRLFHNTDDINSKKIFDSSLDYIDSMLKLIPKNIINLKTNLDNIPDNDEKLIFDVYFQKCAYESSTNLYDYKTNFLNYYNFGKYTNLYYHIISNTPITENISKTETYQSLLNYLFIVFNFNSFTNLKIQLSDFIINSDDINNKQIQIDMSDFINRNTNTIKTNTANLILKNVYSMINTSDLLVNIAIKDLDNEILKINEYFFNYLKVEGININLDISTFIFNALSHVAGIEILDKLVDPANNVLNSPYQSEIFSTEEEFISNYLNKVSKYNIRTYMYLLYLYKYWPMKFMNVLPIILTKYIQDIIIPEDDSYNKLDEHYFYSLNIKYLNSRINFDKYHLVLSNTLTKENLEEYIEKYSVVQFSTIFYLLQTLDNFTNSADFTSYLEVVLEKMYSNLKEEGYVDYTFKWYEAIEVLKIYYKLLFRVGLFNNSLFNNITSTLNSKIKNLLTNENIINYTEELEGVPQTNLLFRTSHQFNEDSLEVYVDDVLLDKSKYTMFGVQHIIRLNEHQIGSTLKVKYDIYYDIELNTEYDKILESFTQHCTSTSVSNSINNIMQSLYLSSIIKQINFDVINYFLK